MTILVTGANGQLGNEMQIVAKQSSDNKTKIKDTFGITIPYWKSSLKVCLDNIN